MMSYSAYSLILAAFTIVFALFLLWMGKTPLAVYYQHVSVTIVNGNPVSCFIKSGHVISHIPLIACVYPSYSLLSYLFSFLKWALIYFYAYCCNENFHSSKHSAVFVVLLTLPSTHLWNFILIMVCSYFSTFCLFFHIFLPNTSEDV